LNKMDSMDIQKIMQLLPHRFPFLLVDRVTEVIPGKELTGYKNISINEPFFQGHFPIKPIFPGVLIIEALAQATGLLAFATENINTTEDSTSLFYLVGVDSARFKQPAVPGDQLILHAEIDKVKRGVWKFEAQASVDGKVIASADLMCAVRDVDL